MSDARAALLRKISKLSSEIGFVEFDGRNTGQNYGYATAAGVIRTLNKKMAEIGLVLTSESESLHFSVETNHKGQLVQYALVKETIRIHDVETGEFVESSGTGSGIDPGDKAQFKASTGAFKYAIAHLLCLGWGAEDPEADESTDKRSKETVDLPAAIAAANSLAKLEKLRKAILARKGQKDYDELVAAYKTREEILK